MTLPMSTFSGDYSYMYCMHEAQWFYSSSGLTSKVASFLRMMPTSVACNGATACFISTACFFTLFHCSGNSCRKEQRWGIQNNLTKKAIAPVYTMSLLAYLCSKLLEERLYMCQYWPTWVYKALKWIWMPKIPKRAPPILEKSYTSGKWEHGLYCKVELYRHT